MPGSLPPASPPAVPPPRRGRRPQVSPVDLVDAALAVFSEKGFAAARLDDVAKRAGVSKGTLYLYFPSKEALFKAVVRQTILPNLDGFEALVRQYQGPSGPLLTTLIQAATQVMANTKAGLVPKMVLAEAGNFPDLARFYVDEVVGRAVALMTSVLEKGVASGEFSPLGAETAKVVMAPCLLAALWNHGLGAAVGQRLDPETFAAEIIRVMLHGLIHREAP